MDKLKNYTDKLQLENEIKTYGSDYFYNVKPFYCNGMFLTVYYSHDPETTRKTVEKLEKVKRYCKRYGYVFKRLNSPVGLEWYQIFKADDLETLKYYQSYIDLSVLECEKVIHEFHLQGITHGKELNTKLREIMDFYGNNLKAFFKSIAA